MSDWVIDNEDTGKATQQLNPAEWEIAPDEAQSPTQEDNSYWGALKSAPGKIAGDIGGAISGAVRAIPDYYQKAKSEIPALFNPYAEWRKHPLHVAGQGLAGINEAINSIAQFPLNVAKYGSNRLNLIPQAIPNAIQTITPEDTTQAINNIFGEPQYPGETLLRGAGRNALPIAGITKLARDMPHLTKYGATRALNKAQRLAAKRDIGALNVDPQLIEDTRQFLPNTTPYRNTLEDSQGGNYNALFNLQSDLGKNAGDYANSWFSAAERAHGRAGLETRNRLLDAMHENLKAQGHEDISSLLKKGQIDYRKYMAFKPYRNAIRNALIAAGVGLVFPDNPLSAVAKKVLSNKS